MDTQTEVEKPSEVSDDRGFFDSFADHASTFVSRAPFFIFCVVLVLVWFPTLFFLTVDTSQLIINTATTIITFLMVALLQNSQTRFESATNKKLNALSDAVADLMEYIAANDESDKCTVLTNHAKELRAAVGLEQREST